MSETPAAVAAALSPTMWAALHEWTFGQPTGLVRRGTYYALRRRGLVELAFGHGERGPLGGKPAFGITRVTVTPLGHAVADVLEGARS